MLLLTLFAAFLPATLAVTCYTCSWSPTDAANRTAMCTDDQFEGKYLATSECDNGCQTYIHIDRNGALEQVRRSCLQADEKITGDCVSDENKAFSSKRCTCNYHLCNTAPSLYYASATLLFVAVFVLQLLNRI